MTLFSVKKFCIHLSCSSRLATDHVKFLLYHSIEIEQQYKGKLIFIGLSFILGSTKPTPTIAETALFRLNTIFFVFLTIVANTF